MTTNRIDSFFFEGEKPWVRFLTADHSTSSPAIRTVAFIARILIAVARDFADGAVTLRAMSLVYTTLLSIVPLLAIVFSVLKGFGAHNQLEPMIMGFLEPFGEKGGEITQTIIGFVDNMQVGLLGSVGLALLLYTVISLLQKVEGAFNAQWRIEKPRSLARRFSDYLSVVMIAPILIFASMGLSTSLTTLPLLKELAQIEPFGTLLSLILRTIPFILSLAGFTFFYIFIPNTRVKLGPAIAGAATASILWKITGWVFTTFIVSSGNYDAVYSAFAGLILLLIWTYLTWVILISGATVSYYVQNPGAVRQIGGTGFISANARQELALRIMQIIVERYYAKGGATGLAGLEEKTRAHPTALTRTISALMDADLLMAQEGERDAYAPAKPPEETPLADVISAIRAFGDPVQSTSSAKVREIQSLLTASYSQALAGKTLKDLI